MVDYDRLTAEYVCHRRIHSGVLEILRARTGTAKGSKVLEVGCGTGNYIRALQELTGCTCFGIDPSKQMVAEARKRSSGIEFRAGSAENLRFPEETFDFVFSVDVVHHMTNWKAYLGEAWRVLKPAGQLCTVTDSECQIRHRRPLIDYFPAILDIELARYPRIEKLRETMAQMGFANIEEDVLNWRYKVTDIRLYKDKAYSCLHLISSEAFQKGIAQMEKNLLAGPLEGEGGNVLLWGTKGGPQE